MADPTPPRSEIRALVDKIDALGKRVTDLERPSGTQQFNAVPNLEQAIADIQEQQTQIVAVQDDIIATNEAQAEQIAFLQTASVQDSRGSVTNETRGASGGISLEGVDGTYDCSVSLTTSSTGKLRVSVGAQLTGSDGVSAVVGYEVLIGGTVVVGVDWPRVAAAGGGLATTSRESLITVAANTAITVRTRRGWTGGTGGLCVWGYQSLIVTKEGL